MSGSERHSCLHSRRPRSWFVAFLCVLGTVGHSQGLATRPGRPLTVLTPAARQALPTTLAGTQELVSLNDLATLFAFSIKDDTQTGGILVTAGGRSLLLSTTQGLASASGRLVSLSGPPIKQGATWLVPLDALNRALPLLLDTRIDLRRDSRLVVVGDVRVPRVLVRVDPQGGPVRVAFAISPATPHVVEQDSSRLIIRFEATALDATLPPPIQSDVLSGLRLEGANAISVDLGPAFTSYRASDQPDDAGGVRLTLDLISSAPPATSGSSPTAPAPSTAPPQPPPLLFEPPTSALRTIVLDPGHGGEELGAKGPGGTLEKDIAASIARQLKAALESRMGVRVYLTRDGDQTVPLDQRAALANNNKADLFLSLHVNASVSPAARGAEVFFLSAGEYNAEARQQAAIEGELLPAVNGGNRKVEMILWEMAQLQHLEDSGALARLVEARLRERVPMSRSAIQQAPFRVLVGANMPAVLVELGFVTNPEEEKLLASPAHQALLVQALYDSLAAFRSYLENGRQRVATAADRPASAGAGLTASGAR